MTKQKKNKIKSELRKYLKDEELYLEADEVILDDYANTLELIESCEDSITKHGVIIKDNRGTDSFKNNPATSTLAQAKTHLTKLYKLLALGEYNRIKVERMAVDPNELDDEF